MEYLRTKFDTAGSIPEGTFSKRWVAKNILALSDDEFLRNQRESFYDRKYQQALEGVVDEGAEEALGDDMGGLGGEELGGDLGGEDLGGEEMEAPAGEESALLTAPARREDDEKTRHYEKSSYRTVQGRGGDSRIRGRSGPISRQIKNKALPEAPRLHTDRSKTPGRLGMPDFKSLVGLEEQKQSIYNNSEARMLENTMRVRQLVEELERKEALKDEAQ